VSRAPQIVAVYCGSRAGGDPRLQRAAEDIGTLLAQDGHAIVYGGASVGLMGAVADSALNAGGRVIGVRPQGLFPAEPAHTDLTELHIVGSMHERKRTMSELADVFVGLPGGLGTLDEIVEALSWSELGIHDKPVLLLDIDGYWAPIALFLERAVAHGLAPAGVLELYSMYDSPEALVDGLRDQSNG
jgi:uncharacterized protein (TIGR00730 family)